MARIRARRGAVWVVSGAIVAVAGIGAIGSTAPAATSSSYLGESLADPHSDPPGPCYWEERNQHRMKDGVRYTCRPSGTEENGLGWFDDEGRQ